MPGGHTVLTELGGLAENSNSSITIKCFIAPRKSLDLDWTSGLPRTSGCNSRMPSVPRMPSASNSSR